MYCHGSSIYYVDYRDIHVLSWKYYILCVLQGYPRIVVEVVYIMCITGISKYCRVSSIYYVYYRDIHVLLPDSCLTHSPQNVPPVMLTS